MVSFTRSMATLSMACLISVLMIGCSESKVSQCNKLTAVVNKAAKDALETGAKSGDQAAKLNNLTQLAGRLDDYAKEMEAIELKDEKLKDSQGRFIKMYRDASKSSRDLVSAVNKKDGKAAQQALQSIQTSTSQEKPLVGKVNQYCTGK